MTTRLDAGAPPHVFISYKHGPDESVVRPLVTELESRGVDCYFDSVYQPAEDVDGLGVGLSAGLSMCPVLVAFVSEGFLRSRWCCAELREFIFRNGIRLGRDEIAEWARTPLESHALKGRLVLPMLPIVLVILERTVSEDRIARALMPENRFDDTSRRTTVVRGPEDSEYYEESIEYMRSRGVDASAYVHLLPRIDAIDSDTPTLADALVSTLAVVRCHLPASAPQARHPLDAATLWERIWTLSSHPKIASTFNPAQITDAIPHEPGRTPARDAPPSEEHDPLLFGLLDAIAHGVRSVEFYDRRAARKARRVRKEEIVRLVPFVGTPTMPLGQKIALARNMAREMAADQDVRAESRRGDPLELLVADAQTLDILRPLQATFYDHRRLRGADERVTLAVVGCCLINIDLAFEGIRTEEDVRDLVVKPLAEGTDLRSQFPFPFRNLADAIDDQQLLQDVAVMEERAEATARRMAALRDAGLRLPGSGDST